MRITRNHDGDILIFDDKDRAHLLHEIEGFQEMATLMLFQIQRRTGRLNETFDRGGRRNENNEGDPL